MVNYGVGQQFDFNADVFFYVVLPPIIFHQVLAGLGSAVPPREIAFVWLGGRERIGMEGTPCGGVVSAPRGCPHFVQATLRLWPVCRVEVP